MYRISTPPISIYPIKSNLSSYDIIGRFTVNASNNKFLILSFWLKIKTFYPSPIRNDNGFAGCKSPIIFNDIFSKDMSYLPFDKILLFICFFGYLSLLICIKGI